MARDKKGKKRFFLWAGILAALGAMGAIFKRRRARGVEESEWQELPPAEGS